MIKVLHVFNQLNQGGIEHVVINWLKNKHNDDIEFHFAMTSGTRGLLDDEVTKLGGKIHYFTNGSKSFFNVKKNLDQIISEYGPFNVVHSHIYFSSGMILKIASDAGVPIRIAHAHDTFKGEQQSLKRKLFESIMRHEINKYATYKFGVSEDACNHVFGSMDDHTYIVNTGINLDDYKFNQKFRDVLRNELGYSNKNKVIVHIGRFEDQKDHNYLVDVFNLLTDVNDGYRLLLVGNGTLKERIKNKINELGLSNYVTFLENRNDIPRILMAADIFVMPSKYEGLPVVLVEAQGTGIPCIISDKITSDAVLQRNVVVLSKDNKELWCQKIQSTNLTRINFDETKNRLQNFDIKKITKFVIAKYI